jgi:hypothetical protein
MFCESIFHMSLKQKISNEYMDMKACAMWFLKLFMVLNMYLFMYLFIVYSNMPHDYFTTHKEVIIIIYYCINIMFSSHMMLK